MFVHVIEAASPGVIGLTDEPEHYAGIRLLRSIIIAHMCCSICKKEL